MDITEKIDSLVKEDMELGKQMDRIVMRINASVALLKQEMREVTWSYEEELERMGRQRERVRSEILSLWKENFDGKNTVEFPSAKVTLRNHRELAIHDKLALFNALDRAGRLDLVDYIFNEKEIAKLSAKGRLGLDGAAEIIDNIKPWIRQYGTKRRKRRAWNERTWEEEHGENALLSEVKEPGQHWDI